MDQSTRDTIQINMSQEERIIKILERVSNGLDDIKGAVTNATYSINSALGSINSCVAGLSEEIRDAVIQMKQGKQLPSNSFGELQPTSALAVHQAGLPISLPHNQQGPVQNFTSSSHFNIQNTKGNSRLEEEKKSGTPKKQPTIQRYKSLSEFQRQRVVIEPKKQHHQTKAYLETNIATDTKSNKPVQKRSAELIQKLAGSSSQSRDRESEQSLPSSLNGFIKTCYMILQEKLAEGQSIDQKQQKLEYLERQVESKQKEQSKKNVLEVLRLELANAKLKLKLEKLEMKG